MTASAVPIVRDINILRELDDDSDPGDTSVGLTGVLGVPAGVGPWPAIVAVHEAFGVDDQMRLHVRRLTDAGYLVLMPDLYTQGGARKCLTATFRTLVAGTGRAYQDIEAARRMLLERDDCTGAVGVIGFCMGGGFALMTATRGFDVASANYGTLPKDADAALAGACPIIGTYGADDKTLRGAAGKLEAALVRVGVTHEVTEYAGAGHAFLNEGESGPKLLRPISRVMGIGPRPEQATEAWKKIEAFFDRYLRGAGEPSTV
ncbi:MAG: carboxymethylenebutenolidase [Glaciihabitans sp.]|nr:carboxymethylenebutenolidase [Glaciihabitans sp.]